jgi:hypothetical protein
MSTLLRRPVVALLTTALAASVVGITPAAQAVTTGTISGTVTGSGVPLGDVQVELYEFNPSYGGYWDDTSYSADTYPDGQYSIVAPEGAYRIRFSDYSGGFVEEYFVNAADVESANTVAVSAAAPYVADADLAVAAHVTGLVTGPGAVPLEDIDVTAWKKVVEDAGTPYQYVDYRYGGSVPTDSLGRYDIGGLTGGTYRVEFASNRFYHPREYATEFYDNQTSLESDATQDLVIASTATRSGVNAELALSSEISGVVTNALDAPFPATEVEALIKSGTHWYPIGYDVTASDGTYQLEGLPTGTYRVRFNAHMGGSDHEIEFWNNVGRLANATDVPVGDNVTVPEINAKIVAGEHDNEVGPSFTNTAPPTISGAPVVGQTLTAGTGSWTPTPNRFYFEWYRDGQYIEDADASTYVLTAADLGKTITAGVAAGDEYSEYEYGYAESAPTAPVASTPPVVTPPVVTPPVVTPPAPVVDIPTALAKALAAIKVTGKAKVGKTLKVANLDLDLRTAVTYKLQWFAGTKKIKKATKSKLKVLKSMKGKKISVKVTGTAGSTSKSVKIKVGKVK